MPKIYVAGDKLLATELTEIVKVAGLFASDGGSGDAYAISVTPAPSGYVTGDVYTFKAAVANTGPATLNVNSLGAKTIKKNVNEDLSDNDIKAGQLCIVQYDGTNFQLISAQQPRPLYKTGQTSKASGSGTGTLTIPHGLGVTPKLVKITAVGLNTTNPANNISVGTGTSTSDESCVTFRSSGAPFLNNAAIIEHQGSDGTTRVVAILSALDVTNITLDFTTFANQAQSLLIQWEAYA